MSGDSTQGESDDRLVGAAAIAAAFGFTPRQVTHLRDKGSAPIRKRAGLGLYAFKSEMEAWLRDPDTLPGTARKIA